MKRLWISRGINILLGLVITYQLVSYWQRTQSAKEIEGKTLQPVQLTDLKGSAVTLPTTRERHALVFWASWCGPCKIDLYRINAAVDRGEIKRSQITAVALEEDVDTVTETVAERGYEFPVVVDREGLLARQLNIPATPTVALLEGNQVKQMSVGVSVVLTSWLKGFLAAE